MAALRGYGPLRYRRLLLLTPATPRPKTPDGVVSKKLHVAGRSHEDVASSCGERIGGSIPGSAGCFCKDLCTDSTIATGIPKFHLTQ